MLRSINPGNGSKIGNDKPARRFVSQTSRTIVGPNTEFASRAAAGRRGRAHCNSLCGSAIYGATTNPSARRPAPAKMERTPPRQATEPTV